MESLTKNFSSSAYAISMLKHRFITMRHDWQSMIYLAG